MEDPNKESGKKESGEEMPKKKRGWPKGKPRKPKDEKKQDPVEKEPKEHKKRRRRRKCRLVERATENQPTVKKPEACGVRIIAFAVKADGDARIKLTKKDTVELAPCEELIFKLTLEKDGIPVNSVFNEVRTFAEAFALCSGLKVVPQ